VQRQQARAHQGKAGFSFPGEEKIDTVQSAPGVALRAGIHARSQRDKSLNKPLLEDQLATPHMTNGATSSLRDGGIMVKKGTIRETKLYQLTLNLILNYDFATK
jgi:hypothetical protein